MAATVEDDDTIAGFVAYWALDPNLSSLVPAGPQQVPLPSPQPPETQGLPPVWAEIACTQGQRGNELAYAAVNPVGVPVWDFRRVTLKVHGRKQDVVKTLGAIRPAFEWQPKTRIDVSGQATSPLSMPSGVAVKRVMPLPGTPHYEEAKVKKSGEDYWTAIAEYEVWTVRSVP